jgi:uncharacterized cupredoxin-like copper-binding protein
MEPIMTFFRSAFACAAFASLFVASPVLAQAAPQEIDVALTNFAFTPDTLSLHANTPYRLHLVNGGTSAHNFAAPEFFAASTIAPGDAAKVQGGAIEVAKGQSIDVTLTPIKAGSYDLKCTHFMHTMFGMKGAVTVQ